jgi:glutamyl-tRNA synthetase
MNSYRVRFAPSPTGPLHIGGVRTALFNYLFAKKNGGTFVLRIEDTDQTRYVSNAEKYITDTLEWCNIPFDEGPGKNEKYGPYRQSERKHLYKKYIDLLLEKGKAYYAFDTAEALDFHRKDHVAKGKTFIYNHHNRGKLTNSISLEKSEVEARISKGEKYVVRFKMFDPENNVDATIETNDMVRGHVSFKKELLDDKILFKSDGMPTYHLANVVDDHLMKISHVIRGEEWLPSLPLHIALYDAFSWEKPAFAHLPLILKPVGKGKLSKRDGDKLGFPVFPLNYTNEQNGEVSSGYREEGYFPETVINFLALLGWNPGTEQELFSLEELIAAFDLNKVNKSGARFDPDKTKWFNQQYLVQKSDHELAKLFQDDLQKHNIILSVDKVEKVVAMLKERAVFVTDLWDLGSFFFQSPNEYDAKTVKKQWKEDTPELMGSLVEILKSIENFTSAIIESKVKDWITSSGYGFGKIMQPLRLSLVGAMKGPHLFDIAEFLGKEETVHRLNQAIDRLS